MEIIENIDELSKKLDNERVGGSTLAFVPTMGYLHAGHLSLLQVAKESASRTIVSIFVNPLQFDNSEDLAKYPTDLDQDKALLLKEGVDYLLIPSHTDIYPPGFQTKVSLTKFTEAFEGKFRPGHFEGVATVVSILFNIVRPDYAVFGEKDFQQMRVIEQMTCDLRIPLKILRAPTARDFDGLALSSRNVRLSKEDREAALSVSRGLFKAKEARQSGVKDADQLKTIVFKEIVAAKKLQVEYIALVEEDNLQEIHRAAEKTRILVAVKVSGVRLIDNIRLY